MRIIPTASLIAIVSALTFGCKNESKDPNDPKSKEVPVEPGKTTAISEDGREFVMTALRDGMLEVEAGKLAKTKATDESVKKLASMMVEQHSKANEELTALARSHNLEVPTTLSKDGLEKLQKLQEEDVEDFNDKYVDMMVDAHQDAVDLFEKEMKRDKDDGDLAQWASKTVPTLRMHLEEAKTAKKLLDEKDDLIKDDDLVKPDGTPQPGVMPGADAAAQDAAKHDVTRAPGSAQ